MKSHGDSSRPTLRARAEAQLAARRAESMPDSHADLVRLIHELEVHRIELQMQNEELRAARAEIEAGLERHTALFDFAPIGYAVLDSQGAIVQVNFAGARMLGGPGGQLAGRPFARFVDPPQRAAFADFLTGVQAKRADEEAGTCELLLLDPAGKPPALEVHLTGSVLPGAPPGVMIAIEDVTPRKRAEALREESLRKDAFLATLSHELRNPLTPISYGLSLLDRAEPGGPVAKEALAILGRQVRHLVCLVDDLLDVSRIARGKIRLRREPLDLAELARRTIDDHRPGFQTAAIALHCHLGSEPVWIDADATRVVQMIGNLLGNASKFTPAGGRVDVVVGKEGAQAKLSVRDDGAGIPHEIQASVFEPFIQAPQTLDRSRGGLGLGLAMVKGFVELHGGTVHVQSDGVGRGSELTVRLPLCEAPEKAPAPAVHPREERHRVLVVEDNADAAEALRLALEDEGHQVRIAHDGPTALALARDFRPEVVLCDLGLPGMDGFQVACAIRADGALRDAYLIALSGYARPEDRQRAAEAGFDRHLAKPPHLDELHRIVAEPRRRPAG